MKQLLFISVLIASTCSALAQGSQPQQVGAIVLSETRGDAYHSGVRFPIIPLEGGKVRIDFDLLGAEEPVLNYRVRHCNSSWQLSSLAPIEYISGLESYELPMPQPSRNTLQPYTHYQLEIPNEVTRLKVSGNYIVQIYDADRPEETLLSVPIAVSEERLTPLGRQTDQTALEVRGRYQAIEVEVPNASSVSARPESELSIVVLQNGRWDSSVRLTAPSESGYQGLRYTDFKAAIFEAGNEYSKLEHLTDRGGGMGIHTTNVVSGLYLHELYPQRNTSQDNYLYEADQDGREIIRALHTSTPETDADYHLVRFYFTSPRLQNGRVILEGQCVSFLPVEQRTMRYNETKQQYEATLLLKMGYHEYQYLFLPDTASKPTPIPTVGSHYQTSNEYTLLLYLRGPQDRADRLIGFSKL